jgi:hypothetical protein
MRGGGAGGGGEGGGGGAGGAGGAGGVICGFLEWQWKQDSYRRGIKDISSLECGNMYVICFGSLIPSGYFEISLQEA